MILNVVVLYSSGHLGSAIIMNKLLEMPSINIVGVVKAQPLKLSFKGYRRIKRHLTKVGWRFAWLLFWQRCVQALGYLITLVFPFLRKRLKPAWKIAADHNIPVFHCENVNDVACQEFMKQCESDLIISAYFSQILKKEIISFPKQGVLNVHPGWLPAYKGAMAYFWVLKNGSDRGGVTLHWMDEGIDTGEIIARRSFPLKIKATQETVLIHTAVIGARLIQRAVKKIVAGEALQTIPVETEADEYYSLPTDEDFESYFERRRFFRIRDVLGLLVMKKYR